MSWKAHAKPLVPARFWSNLNAMRANRIRELWAAGKPALNCWITLPGTLAAEMLAHQGWDSLTVDLQHGGSDFASMCAMFAAISTTDTVPLMRVAWNTPGDVMRALDAGAYGVICPNIDNRGGMRALCRRLPLSARRLSQLRAQARAALWRQGLCPSRQRDAAGHHPDRNLEGAAECRCHRQGEGPGHALCRAVGPGAGAGAGGAAEPDRSGGDGGGGQDPGARPSRPG